MKKITTIVAALGVTWALAACGGASSPDTMEDLRHRVIAAAEQGSYVKLATQCSPDTMAQGMGAMVMAKAFDPDGEFLKAALASLRNDNEWHYEISADGKSAVYGDDNDRAVFVKGKWWMDCSDVE